MTDFPNDIEQLKAMLLKLEQEKQAMAEEVTALKTQVQLLVEQQDALPSAPKARGANAYLKCPVLRLL